jgi:hypothetical protein
VSAWDAFDGHRDSSVARRPGAATPDRPSRHRPPNVASNKIQLAVPDGAGRTGKRTELGRGGAGRERGRRSAHGDSLHLDERVR